MKKVFKTRNFVVPSDLPEKLDKTAKSEHKFIDMMAEAGNLHDIDTWALAVPVGWALKDIMEADGLPEKRMSLERLTDALWVVMFAYCLGTMELDGDTGELIIGTMRDASYVMDVINYEKIQFRTGKVMPMGEFMDYVKGNTENVGDIYKDVSKRLFSYQQ